MSNFSYKNKKVVSPCLILVGGTIMIYLTSDYSQKVPMLQYLAGMIMMAIGGGVMFNSLIDLASKNNGFKLIGFGNPKTVVKRGFYAFSRHPMYLGMILFHVGFILISTSSLGWYSLSMLVIYTYMIEIPMEEDFMKEKFGSQYIEYKKETGLLFKSKRANA